MNAVTKVETVNLQATEVQFEINGKQVKGLSHETILEVAKRNGIKIPHLCYKQGLETAGNCRACMVEIDGERVLAPSCCRHPSNNMKVTTDSERAVKSQKMVLELLQSDMPEAEYTRHNEVDFWADKLGVGKPRFAPPGGARLRQEHHRRLHRLGRLDRRPADPGRRGAGAAPTRLTAWPRRWAQAAVECEPVSRAVQRPVVERAWQAGGRGHADGAHPGARTTLTRCLRNAHGKPAPGLRHDCATRRSRLQGVTDDCATTAPQRARSTLHASMEVPDERP